MNILIQIGNFGTTMASKLRIRNMEVRFVLQYGNKFQGKYNTKIINQLSMEAKVTKTGGVSKDSADITIYGMLLDDITQLTTLNYLTNDVNRNRVELYAGYDDVLSLLFVGDIVTASADLSDVNRPFKVQAQTGFYAGATNAPNTNVKGKIKAQDIFSNLAQQANLTFVNQDVDVLVSNPIFIGGITEQISALANQIGVISKIDGDVLTISKNSTAFGKKVVLLNKDSGLLGYPKIDNQGVVFRAYFNPEIKYRYDIKLESIAPKCSGVWNIYELQYDLKNHGDKFEILIKASKGLTTNKSGATLE